MNVRKFLPLVILGVLVMVAAVILRNPPEAERRGPPGGPKVNVEAMAVRSAPYQVYLQSYGTVQPRTQSMLVAQVSGEVTAINPNFREGGLLPKTICCYRSMSATMRPTCGSPKAV